MIDAAITFTLVFLINIFYTKYLKAVQNNLAFNASAWSAVINIAASIAAINYVENHWLLVPSCLGSFAGTYASMKLEKRN
jgi:hypothetical protein